jgi:hypothetical protein
MAVAKRLDAVQRAGLLGYARALGTVMQITNDGAAVAEAARYVALTLTELRRWGCSEFDIRQLKRAGVPSRHPRNFTRACGYAKEDGHE